MDGTVLEYRGEKDRDGLPAGTWTLSLDVDALEGSASMTANSRC